MLKYGYPGSLIRSNVEQAKLSVSDTADVLELDQVSKGLTLINVGANTAYITFDDDPVTTNKYAILAGKEMVLSYSQIKKIRYICAATETTDIRVLATY